MFVCDETVCLSALLCALFCVCNYQKIRSLTLVWRCSIINELMINDEIREKEIRLIGSDGVQLGIVATREAQRMADEKQLDLVKIAPQASPPVCRIMDYSKFKFEQTKKEKEARRRQKTIEIKEIRLSPNIDTHDVNVRLKQALDFLKSGDKVKVSIRFRYGREMGRAAAAQTIMMEFAKSVEDVGVIERPPKMEGRNMFMFLNPKKQPIPTPAPEQPEIQKASTTTT